MVMSMTRFAANLSMLFTEVPFLQRFAEAASAGFSAVEFQFPYDHPAEDIAAATPDLDMLMFNLPPGDWAKGERGIACHPGRSHEFQKGVTLAIDYAKALNVSKVNCLSGLRPAGFSDAACRDALLENLHYAAAALAQHKIELMIEPINHFDMPGFFVSTPAQALSLMDEVQHENITLQYDIYHAARMGCDVASELTAMLPRIGHIQFADAPGRHEPGTGTLDLKIFFALLREAGYGRPLAAEYRPKTNTRQGLGWLSSFQTS
jgi:hydroxypyruvate isomerase